MLSKEKAVDLASDLWDMGEKALGEMSEVKPELLENAAYWAGCDYLGYAIVYPIPHVPVLLDWCEGEVSVFGQFDDVCNLVFIC